MKTRTSLASATVAAVIAGVFASAAFAADPYSEDSGLVRLQSLANGAANVGKPEATASKRPCGNARSVVDPALRSEDGGLLWLSQLANGAANVGRPEATASTLVC